MHDEKGKALTTARYGRMPKGDVTELCARMAEDVAAMLVKRPALEVTALTDGAPERRDELRMALNEETLGEPVHERIDFWRVIEKLGKAAVVIRGREESAPTQRWKMALLHQAPATATEEANGLGSREAPRLTQYCSGEVGRQLHLVFVRSCRGVRLPAIKPLSESKGRSATALSTWFKRHGV